MTDFLLELRSEEIPARMQDKARADLERLFVAELARAGLAAAGLETYATPRRLALIARDLPARTQAVSEELKGPRAGAPPQALEGFLRKTGLTADQLTTRDGVLFAVIERPGRATADVLAQAIPAIVRAFPWPKSMRWGDASASTESLRWVRPLQGIVAMLGHELIACEVAGIASGRTTAGHRFHSPQAITLDGAGDYADKLREAHVIVDQDERRAIIREGAAALAAQAGLALIEDEGLVAENAGLTEWPVPLLGRFDAAFLDVPPEVIQLTARVNQKYFVCQVPPRNGEGDHAQHGGGGAPQTPRLANAFICVANIAASDGGARIVEGNQKVLAARLSDARFFYDTDLKVSLEEQAGKLEKIVFHERLGTVADKVDRVAKLARWLVEEGIVKSPSRLREGLGEGLSAGGVSSVTSPPPTPPAGGRGEEDLAHLAERAARLCKADLVTGMVGEFPELQGAMGGYYARAQGEDPRVADAIRDHYKPVGQGDEVPTAPVTVAVSLADKLDTIFSFFAVAQMPTGSKDPFALRRAALGVVTIEEANRLRLPLRRAFEANHAHWLMALARHWADRREVPLPEFEVAISDFNEFRSRVQETLHFQVDQNYADQFWQESFVRKPEMWSAVLDFFADRLKVQQREAGVRHDLIDAVFALGNEDDLVRLLARVHALQAFVQTPEGANLLAGYKRAANILKKEGVAPSAPSPLRGEGRGEGLSTGDGPAVSPDFPSPNPLPGGERAFALSYTPEPAEAALIAALDSAEPRAAAAIAAEDFAEAMTALASLRAPIDQFFETVTVNDPDPPKREARLALLARMRDAVHAVADFSKIDG